MTQPGVGQSLFPLLGRAVGLAMLAAGLGGTMGLLHRWYVRSEVPPGLAILVGVGGVALYLNTAGALGEVIGGDRGLLTMRVVLFNVGTLAVGTVLAAAGGRAGDRLAASVIAQDGHLRPDVDVSRLVRSMGRVITVDLPTTVEDLDGYDPVDQVRKDALAGETLVFDRGLTVGELRERLVARIKSDYGVGHVDLDLDDEGSVTYLAVGSRAAGLGPTLPPGTCAVALRADPAQAASAGDLVQLYETGAGPPRRVATGDLRGTAGDVVTVAVDTADAADLDPTERYRLATLPVEPRADREFAALLRGADETLGVTTVGEGSALDGATVADVAASVVAVATGADAIDPIPPGDRRLATGDTVYAIGRPDRLRSLEAAARPATDSL